VFLLLLLHLYHMTYTRREQMPPALLRRVVLRKISLPLSLHAALCSELTHPFSSWIKTHLLQNMATLTQPHPHHLEDHMVDESPLALPKAK